jgi:NAD-dependent SIR2 family protein deacetylase
MYEEIIEAIKNSDRILVGIGEEATVKTSYNGDSYMKLEEVRQYNDEIDRIKDKLLAFYNGLADIIRDKDYFVITTNYDGIISESKLNKLKTVAPCGNIHKLQCGCDEITDMPEDFFDNNIVCPKCKTQYQVNVFNRQNYNENGYLKQWNIYNIWLQGTIGKKLLILEFGCSFSFASVIRIPFERIAMINQKAVYYRVSEKYPQITAQLNDKLYSYKENPFDFVSGITGINV